MTASQAVIVVGAFSVILVVMTTMMARLNRIASQRIERRRAAWKAEGGVGPCPGDTTSRGGYNASLNFGWPSF
jgi:hypothetical protein